MARRITYRDVLRAKGVKPLPRYGQLRTAKSIGDLEQQPVSSKNSKAFVELETGTPKPPKLRIVAKEGRRNVG